MHEEVITDHVNSHEQSVFENQNNMEITLSPEKLQNYRNRVVNPGYPTHTPVDIHLYVTWINQRTQLTLKEDRIQDLVTGIPYCLLLNQIFPHLINLETIKIAVVDHITKKECLHNFKKLYNGFKQLEIYTRFDINRLSNGDVSENLEFLGWFKMFYDKNMYGALMEREAAGESVEITQLLKPQILGQVRDIKSSKIKEEIENIRKEARITMENIDEVYENLFEIEQQCEFANKMVEKVEKKYDMLYENLQNMSKIRWVQRAKLKKEVEKKEKEVEEKKEALLNLEIQAGDVKKSLQLFTAREALLLMKLKALRQREKSLPTKLKNRS